MNASDLNMSFKVQGSKTKERTKGGIFIYQNIQT